MLLRSPLPQMLAKVSAEPPARGWWGTNFKSPRRSWLRLPMEDQTLHWTPQNSFGVSKPGRLKVQHQSVRYHRHCSRRGGHNKSGQILPVDPRRSQAPLILPSKSPPSDSREPGPVAPRPRLCYHYERHSCCLSQIPGVVPREVPLRPVALFGFLKSAKPIVAIQANGPTRTVNHIR